VLKRLHQGLGILICGVTICATGLVLVSISKLASMTGFLDTEPRGGTGTSSGKDLVTEPESDSVGDGNGKDYPRNYHSWTIRDGVRVHTEQADHVV
jgi:hypothetical protein